MKLLIVGSMGFIGSHAIKYFSTFNGFECWGCDIIEATNLSNYYNLNTVPIEEIIKTNDYQICINCSGAANVPYSFSNPFIDFSLNTLNVVKILEAIRLYSPNIKFINMSSAAVYGNPQKLPIHENSRLQPVSPYGWHKLYSEFICSEYNNYFGIGACSLRIFSAYGPGLRKQILWDLFNKSKIDSPIILFGKGDETRDFINIFDIMQAIEVIIRVNLFDNRIFNVANGIGIRIKDLAQEYLTQLGYKSNFGFSGEERVGDPLNWCADINSLSEYGFLPKVNYKEGIKEYITWLKDEQLL